MQKHKLLLQIILSLPFIVFAESPTDSLTQALKRLPEDSNKVNAHYEIARLCLFNESEQAISHAVQALDLAIRLDYKVGQAKVYNLLGVLSDYRGMSAQASEYYLKAIPIFEALGNANGIAKCYTNLATIYSIEKRHDISVEYYLKSLKIQEQRGDTTAMANVLTNLGAAYQRHKEFFKAITEYQKALNLLNDLPEDDEVKRTRVANLINIAMVNREIKNYDESEDYLNKSLALSKAYENKLLQTYIFVTLANLNLDRNRPQDALTQALEGLTISTQLNYVRRTAELYDVLARTYSVLGDHQNAYIYRAKYISTNDGIKESENSTKVEKTRIDQLLQKKILEIQILEKEYRYNIFKKNAIIVIAITASLVLFLVYLRIRQRYKQKIDSNIWESTFREKQVELLRNNLVEKSELYKKLSDELDRASPSVIPNTDSLDSFNSILKSHIITASDWEHFKTTFEKVYPYFFASLRYQYPEITQAELRLCACIKINLSLRESANLLGVSAESVKQFRYRLKKKMDLSKEQSLDELILSIDRPKKDESLID